MFQLNVDKVLR